MNSIGINLNLFPLGWVHFIASLAALALGIVVLLRSKGTAVHRHYGRVYVVAVLVTSMTALAIYRLGHFFFPHWFAVAAIAASLIGVAAAYFRIPRHGWIHLHLTCMLVSSYILVGGGVNEVFLRVGFLRRLVPNLNSPAVGATHLAVMLLFAALIIYFNILILLQSRISKKVAAEAILPNERWSG